MNLYTSSNFDVHNPFPMRVAINGFGRIGRMILRANLMNPRIDIVAINDLGDPAMGAHLMKHDSSYGVLPMNITGEPGKLTIDGKVITLVQNRDPELLPWKDLGIDVVLECTGAFTARDGAAKHIKAGAKRVVISAPAKDAVDRTIVMGVNHHLYNPETDFIVSNASCTTNGLAPVAKVLQDTFGIESGFMNTCHAYTNDQNLHDNDHRDMRRARAAALNMIPSSTGAAKAIGLVIPELSGKMDGLSIRVPTPTVSVLDLTVNLTKPASVEAINAAMKTAAEGPLKGILRYCDLPLVSVDFKGDNHSSIFDSLETRMVGDHLAKVLAWYDNEWGYSMRCVDLVAHMAQAEH